ncbi:MAG: Zn-dependent protease [Oscillospiraceae bacterium]|nr:Zn-dependent protease [Oscillospiraceae bacterium]
MNVKAIRSDGIYTKIMTAPDEKKNDIYRYEMMMPFKQKWDYYHIPLKAATPNGYDIIMASRMLGLIEPRTVDSSQEDNIKLISNEQFWVSCEKSLETSLDCFVKAGIELPVTEYLFTILLADPQSPYTVMNSGYCGDGGIPGYILVWLAPNEYTMQQLPAAIAHETNHNIRFQFIKWRNDITLGDMLVSEGLAENFATYLHGEDKVGPWVAKTDVQTLNQLIKPIIHDGLGVQGLENLNAYLYGDEIAALQNCSPVGLPYCAGYVCGYHLIKHYLNKTGKSILEATLLPANEILNHVEDFWNE